MVNAHTHIYSALAPFGMPAPAVPPANFIEILERVWWRLDRALDLAALRAAARLYVAEASLHGTTALVDHHESPMFIEGSLDVIADACEEFAMPAVVCYGATERNGGRGEARRGLAECRRFILANRRRYVRGIVGLHASFTVSDDTVREAGDLCRDLGAVLHVHVAEDAADVDDAQTRGYAGPLERLEALGALPAGSVLAHGVHLGAAQVRQAADRGCWIVQNPRSNRNNRVGYPRWLGESARVALGTDGFVSNMSDEVSALREEASAHGESLRAAGLRLAAGRDLAWELLGAAALSGAGMAPDTIRDRLDALRAEAREAAGTLWKRMNGDATASPCD